MSAEQDLQIQLSRNICLEKKQADIDPEAKKTKTQLYTAHHTMADSPNRLLRLP